MKAIFTPERYPAILLKTRGPPGSRPITGDILNTFCILLPAVLMNPGPSPEGLGMEGFRSNLRTRRKERRSMLPVFTV